MDSSSERKLSWQDYVGHLTRNDEQTYESAESGTEYSSEELISRFQDEIFMITGGDYPSSVNGGARPLPRIADDEGNHILREAVDQEWYDLTHGKERYNDAEIFIPGETSNGDTFIHYFPEESGTSPHQGWKVRVAADPEEGREVAQAVLPYLRENDISHKVIQDLDTLQRAEGRRNEGKLITIYPKIDSDREQIMQNGRQIFKEEDTGWNAYSINSNTKNAREIVRDLEEELEGSEAGLEGRSIDGDHGEELQYSDSRIHFRYAHHLRTPALIIGDGEIREIGEHEGLVKETGEFVEGSYIGDEIEAATRPDAFL